MIEAIREARFQWEAELGLSLQEIDVWQWVADVVDDATPAFNPFMGAD